MAVGQWVGAVRAPAPLRQVAAGAGRDRAQQVEGRDVRALQLPRARGPEALARVVEVPEVQVAHLRSLDRHYAHHRSRLHGPRVATADGDDVLVRAPALRHRFRHALVELAIEADTSGHVGVAVEAHRVIVSRGRAMLPPCSSTSRRGAWRRKTLRSSGPRLRRRSRWTCARRSSPRPSWAAFCTRRREATGTGSTGWAGPTRTGSTGSVSNGSRCG